jgi:tRNA A37 threonylcarbamoyladenosine dehydratase
VSVAPADAPAGAAAPADPRAHASVARLFGDEGLARLRAARACVVGVGGVGSWAAEALVRSGVGAIVLIDLDHIAVSNLNRQIHALGSTLGAAKVEVMRARLLDIAPDCRVQAVDAFIDPDNVAELVPPDCVVLDAIDAPRAKAALIALCVRRGQPLIVCGAAGGRSDPLALAVDDLARVRGDALLAAVRARLRREHGFSREPGRAFGVSAVHSRQPPAAGAPVAGAQAAGAPLACAGYGSLVTVTAAMGLAAAARLIDAIVRGERGVGGGRQSADAARRHVVCLPPAMPSPPEPRSCPSTLP